MKMDDKKMQKIVNAMEKFMANSLHINPEDEHLQWDNDVERSDAYIWTFEDKGTEYQLAYDFDSQKVQLESVKEDIKYPNIEFYVYGSNGDQGETKGGIETLEEAQKLANEEKDNCDYIAIGIADKENPRAMDFQVWDSEKGTQFKATPKLILENWQEEELELDGPEI